MENFDTLNDSFGGQCKVTLNTRDSNSHKPVAKMHSMIVTLLIGLPS